MYRDVYTKRFPELESLVVQPLEYLMTAKELKNELENVKNNETLLQYLTQVIVQYDVYLKQKHHKYVDICVYSSKL